jgi:hypothetical protein
LQDGATIKDLKYLSEGKIFPVPTLFIASLPEDEQRLSMGEEVPTLFIASLPEDEQRLSMGEEVGTM